MNTPIKNNIYFLLKRLSLRATKRSAAIYYKKHKDGLLRHFVPRNDVTNENGSVIFWILIAVGLMAALSYAFMGSSRNSTGIITDTQAEAYANEIIAYGNEVKSAVKRLQLRGCSDTEISFESNSNSGYTNPNSPTDNSCHVFDIAGGGLRWKEPPAKVISSGFPTAFFNWYVAGSDTIQNIGSNCTDASCTELVISLFGINQSVCTKINDNLKITNPSGNPPQEDMAGSPSFTGSYTYSATYIIGDTATELSGKPNACYSDIPCAYPYCGNYYHTLIAR